MSVQHINKRGQTFHLHQGCTRTGKPKYFFSMKGEGSLADQLPDGFEIYENPNARVFLRRIQPKIITDGEVALVEKGMRQFSQLQYYQIDVKKNAILVFEANQDVDALSEVLSSFPGARVVDMKGLLARLITYSPKLRLVLVDEEKRVFVAQRYCFLGSMEGWMEIGKPGKLQNLTRRYLKHLGKDSYFDLL